MITVAESWEEMRLRLHRESVHQAHARWGEEWLAYLKSLVPVGGAELTKGSFSKPAGRARAAATSSVEEDYSGPRAVWGWRPSYEGTTVRFIGPGPHRAHQVKRIWYGLQRFADFVRGHGRLI